VSYVRASIYDGLPSNEVAEQIDRVMDNRLGQSSHQSVRASLAHWDVVRARHGWSRIITTDSPVRGGKLATFVTYLAYETELAFSSISNYAWGLRTWMKFQRQIDPAYGVVEWADFMDGIEVLTFVPAEPRKEVPGAWIAGAAAHANRAVFWEVQAVLLQLILLYTFSRSESPLQKSWTGEGAFDPHKNLQVQDIDLKIIEGRRCVAVRLKAIKQDPRMQRPEARGDGDWVYIGESEGDCNIVMWLQLYFSFFAGVPRDRTEPFFVARDRNRGLLYAHGMENVRQLWARTPGVTPAMAKTCGLHGLRVAGHNGTSQTLGKDIARVQGGWASDQTQSRYDRFNLADIVRIPGAIVSSWAARNPGFDFDAIGVAGTVDNQPPPPPPPVVAPPVERDVLAVGPRNMRVVQPFAQRQGSGPVLPAVEAAARPVESAGGRRSNRGRGRGRGRSDRPPSSLPSVREVPPAAPPHAAAQHRDSSSSCLSLNRPVRNARLQAGVRYRAGVPGSWTTEEERR
jgi:hypothetical protein